VLKKNVNNALAIGFLNNTVEALTGRKAREGFLYGVELELEGYNVGMEGVPSKNWKRVEEGSLRGEAIEYVFTVPCAYDEAIARVNKLFDTMQKCNVQLKNSYRTSTHVHLNFSDKLGKQVINFFILHTILEELLSYYCGESRKGNLFCLSTRDAEELVNMFERCVFNHGCYREFSNDVRYQSCNLAALNKYGTIELRSMRGANTAKEVNEYLEIVKSMYEFACGENCPEPWRLVESLSHLGMDGFLAQVFSNKLIDKLMKTWPVVKDLRLSLMEGVRLIQMLAYKLEGVWNEEPPPKPRVQKAAPAEGVAGAVVHNRIQFIDGATWFVQANAPNGYRTHGPHGEEIVYDSIDECWKVTETEEPIRFILLNGENIRQGTRRDRQVNWLFYQLRDEREREPDEDIDIDDLDI
jgi:hypothetical protein